MPPSDLTDTFEAMESRPISTAPISTAWADWYKLARETLDLEHDEAVEYANHRLVEEENREQRRSSEAA